MALSAHSKYLIINADDFGYCPKRDEAILDLFKRKSISSTSLLVNGHNVNEACSYAKMYDLPMGIHLNLTEGRPVTEDTSRIASLINSDGVMHGKFGLRQALENGSIRREHVEHEIEMQLNKYLQLMNGQRPRHIDGHQHIHVHPAIVESIARLARQFGIDYIRAPYDRMIVSSKENSNPFYRDVVNQTKLAVKIFEQYSLVYPSYFFGMTTMGKASTLENIEGCLKVFEQDLRTPLFAEFMCHPGYPSDPSLGGCGTGQPDEFSQSSDRLDEYRTLSSEELKNLFDKYHIQLCIYDDLGRKDLINRDMLDDDEVNGDANHYE